jgi:hypothetical protein
MRRRSSPASANARALPELLFCLLTGKIWHIESFAVQFCFIYAEIKTRLNPLRLHKSFKEDFSRAVCHQFRILALAADELKTNRRKG